MIFLFSKLFLLLHGTAMTWDGFFCPFGRSLSSGRVLFFFFFCLTPAMVNNGPIWVWSRKPPLLASVTIYLSWPSVGGRPPPTNRSKAPSVRSYSCHRYGLLNLHPSFFCILNGPIKICDGCLLPGHMVAQILNLHACTLESPLSLNVHFLQRATGS